MAEVQACWKKCDELAQQEGNRDKIAGLSKGVLVNAWDAEVAQLSVEEKVFAVRYGNLLMNCLGKAQEDRDKQDAPELKLAHAAPPGPTNTKPVDVVVPVIPKPKEETPKHERPKDGETEAGAKPSKLPNKEGNVEMGADLQDLNK